ncbi:hypothetical protein ARMSODRAFT_1028121 [Armillaria solidipes]|uniref:CCHC-type domain-containing protein n=1 Tax=Armillaria solidipes TaxID=1076256 RepID=A0A2H3APA9_9AGAR|nr:hypothetical protein ARMSODRAFT_1028121 [Armillaria solidipes]
MYEEWQKKWVFDQTASPSRDACPQKSHTTITSNNQKAGGVTSLSPAKPTSSAPLWEPGTGRWQTTTYGGMGQLMDIGKLRAEGRCFRCHEKRHLGKDCPKKQDYKDIHSVVAEPEQEPKTELKVKASHAVEFGQIAMLLSSGADCKINADFQSSCFGQ